MKINVRFKNLSFRCVIGEFLKEDNSYCIMYYYHESEK